MRCALTQTPTYDLSDTNTCRRCPRDVDWAADRHADRGRSRCGRVIFPRLCLDRRGADCRGRASQDLVDSEKTAGATRCRRDRRVLFRGSGIHTGYTLGKYRLNPASPGFPVNPAPRYLWYRHPPTRPSLMWIKPPAANSPRFHLIERRHSRYLFFECQSSCQPVIIDVKCVVGVFPQVPR